MISAILAATPWGGIGHRGTLPWPKHKEDLAWFKSLTENQIVIMGRNTWEDPKMPKPLPNRLNFVVSSKNVDIKYRHQVRWIPGNLTENIRTIVSENSSKQVFIIGGKQVYEETLPLVDRIYLTRIKLNYTADTRLSLDRLLGNFRLKSVKPGDSCTYEIWDRIS